MQPNLQVQDNWLAAVLASGTSEEGSIEQKHTVLRRKRKKNKQQIGTRICMGTGLDFLASSKQNERGGFVLRSGIM